MQVYPQIIVNVPVPPPNETAQADERPPFDIHQSSQVMQAVREAENELADQGRVLLRASGTEPVIRVMVEGADAKLVERLSRQLSETVESAAREAA